MNAGLLENIAMIIEFSDLGGGIVEKDAGLEAWLTQPEPI